MNSTPLLLVPLAALTILSNKPTPPADNAADLSAFLAQPQVRAMFEQFRQSLGDVNLSSAVDEPGAWEKPRRRGRAREQGLSTGHLQSPEGYYSAARGLTPEDEWQQMFPRYALALRTVR